MEKERKKEAMIIVGLLVLIVLAAVVMERRGNMREEVKEEKTNVEAIAIPSEYSVFAEEISYHPNITGYFAKPESNKSHPGVIMIHEWWGLNENMKLMAKKLAAEGYYVLAVDLYGEVTDNSTKARELAGKVRENNTEAMQNLKSAEEYLKEQGAKKIASLGWCFGGGQALQYSLQDDVNATVIYYGNLVTNTTELEKIEGPVLGIFGSNDTSIPVETVIAFNSSLNNLSIENEIYIYEGVGHAFANPSGMNYAPAETADAWNKTLAFLERNLKK